MSVDLRFVTRICVHRKSVGLTGCHSTICAQNYARPTIQKTAQRNRMNILIVQVPVRAKGLHWRCRVQESSLCNCWPLESYSESYIHQDYHTQNFRIMITTAAITKYVWNSVSWVLRYPSDSQCRMANGRPYNPWSEIPWWWTLVPRKDQLRLSPVVTCSISEVLEHVLPTKEMERERECGSLNWSKLCLQEGAHMSLRSAAAVRFFIRWVSSTFINVDFQYLTQSQKWSQVISI